LCFRTAAGSFKKFGFVPQSVLEQQIGKHLVKHIQTSRTVGFAANMKYVRQAAQQFAQKLGVRLITNAVTIKKWKLFAPFLERDPELSTSRRGEGYR
jgi:hypothetical protein